MKCPDQRTLFEFSRHPSTAREEKEISGHVATCAACRGVLEQYGRVDAALEEWKAVEPSPWFDARVRAAAGAPAAKRRFWALEHFRAVALASLATVSVVGGLLVFRGHSVRRHRAPEATAGERQLKASPESAALRQTLSAEQEVKMYKDLPVLEDYDMLAYFEVLSELPPGAKSAQN